MLHRSEGRRLGRMRGTLFPVLPQSSANGLWWLGKDKQVTRQAFKGEISGVTQTCWRQCTAKGYIVLSLRGSTKTAGQYKELPHTVLPEAINQATSIDSSPLPWVITSGWKHSVGYWKHFAVNSSASVSPQKKKEELSMEISNSSLQRASSELICIK